MQKRLRSRRADPGRNQDATATRVAQLPGNPERTNRTFVCAVLFLDIVDYSKKPVSEQLKIKERFTARIADAIREIAVDHRIILDTGDGVAINFLDDPEDALFVALRLARDFASAPEGDTRVEVRIGVNLGPVRSGGPAQARCAAFLSSSIMRLHLTAGHARINQAGSSKNHARLSKSRLSSQTRPVFQNDTRPRRDTP